MHISKLSDDIKTTIRIAAYQLVIAHKHLSAQEDAAAERGAGYNDAPAPVQAEIDARADAAAAVHIEAMAGLERERDALLATLPTARHAAAIQALVEAAERTEAARPKQAHWSQARQFGDTREVDPLLLAAQEFAWFANLAVGTPGHHTIELHTFGEGWMERPRLYLAGEPPLPTGPQLRTAHRLALALGHEWAHRLDIETIAGVGDDDRLDVEAIVRAVFEDRGAEAEAMATPEDQSPPGIVAPTMTPDDLIVHRTPRIGWSIDGEGIATVEIHRPSVEWCRWRDRKAAQAAVEDPLVAAELDPGPEPAKGDRVVLRAVVGPVGAAKLELVDAYSVRSRHAETLADLLFGAHAGPSDGGPVLAAYLRDGDADLVGRRRMQNADRGPAALSWGESVG